MGCKPAAPKEKTWAGRVDLVVVVAPSLPLRSLAADSPATVPWAGVVADDGDNGDVRGEKAVGGHAAAAATAVAIVRWRP
eukprot:evm.model.NODE_5931_length_8511_cov_32.465752.4